MTDNDDLIRRALHIEVQPCADHGDHITGCRPDRADFWGVYARVRESQDFVPAWHLEDFPTRGEAMAFAERIAAGRPIIEVRP